VHISKQKTWYERQKQRKSLLFFRLIDRSFGFRLAIACIMSLFVLGTINRLEICRSKNYSSNCLLVDSLSIISVSNVEAFSIVTAALIYILEGGKRKQQEHQEALNLLMQVKEMGIVISLARIKAIESLSGDGLWQDGFDFQGANLEQLNVPYTRWREANFSKTILKGANFQQTDLTGTNFTDADLTSANLKGSNLTDVNFTRANLTDANIADANLTRTNFTDANLNNIKN
jgi:uncharacterized protein YjbI with pentapeptide repeats